ncbi:MAG: DUF7483 domain-containing protein [Pseudobdellovibrionaceae bacterium]
MTGFQAKKSQIQKREFLRQLIGFLPKEAKGDLVEHFNDLKEASTSEDDKNLEAHVRYALTESLRLGLFPRRELLKLTALLSSAGLLQWLTPSRAQAGGLIPFAFFKTATASQSYVDDVFATYLYTGNGGTQTITNGIDLSGKGGLVWIKQRSSGGSDSWGGSGSCSHVLSDTSRGMNLSSYSYAIRSNNTDGQSNFGTGGIGANSDGYSVGYNGFANLNASNETYVSWTFRKAAKFFDIVTYTGTGTLDRDISHSLGIKPGMIIIKNLSRATNWAVWHTSQDSVNGGLFNSTVRFSSDNFSPAVGASYGGNIYGSTSPSVTATSFRVTLRDPGNGTTTTGELVNKTGDLYVAYVFAHDTSSNGIIQCGTFTTDGSGNATVNLGWEPQFCIIKNLQSTGYSWEVLDSMRGYGADKSTARRLQTETSSAEASNAVHAATSTGFIFGAGAASNAYIYLAIRRSNKPPTSGSQIFQAAIYTGDGANARTINTTINADSFWMFHRNTANGFFWFERLRGNNNFIQPSSSGAESPWPATAWGMDKQNAIYLNSNNNYINGAGNPLNGVFALRRATGVFDIVVTTAGNSSNSRFFHNLGVIPELIIHKPRSISGQWCIYTQSAGRNSYMYFTTQVWQTLANIWGTSDPTSTDFGINDGAAGFGEGSSTSINYLFATKAGISKVGSYTGDGTTDGSKIIACGFTTGARFILIKRTDSTGDWFVWDTTRGITNGSNDPHLSLNTTNAEITTDDSIDLDNSGFKVKQTTATNINVNAGTYIFLAIA